MKRIVLLTAVAATMLTACNKKKDFPDYKYQSVYFAYQYPVRTLELGEDLNVNTDLDNAHKCMIYAATGGVYESRRDVNISVSVDPSLLGTGLRFGPGLNDVVPMPGKYFSLASNTIVIPKGTIAGGVEVQFTDAFFEDTNSIRNNYVIPLKMTSVTNADTILSDKNFVLYAIKYVNPWHGNYLRRGKDVVTGSVSQTIIRHKQFVEQDDVNKLSTRSMSDVGFPVVVKDVVGNNINVMLVVKVDASGNCIISSATNGITVTGNGKFVKRGEKNSWGSKDRDALYLNYQINLTGMQVVTTDTLVLRDRAVAMETFSPVKK